MEEEEEEDQREMARTKGTKRMEPSAETDKSHLKRNTRKHFDGQTDRRLSYIQIPCLWYRTFPPFRAKAL